MRLRISGSVVNLRLPACARTLSCGQTLIGFLLIFVVVCFLYTYSMPAEGQGEGQQGKEKSHLYMYEMEETKAKKQRRQMDLDLGRHLAPPGKTGLDLDLGGLFLGGAKVKATRMAMAPAEDKRVKLEMILKDILKNNKRPEDVNYNLNISLSDVISMDRKITDTRPKVCKTFR